jgi:two-component system, NtrC family, sensor kinase
VALRWRIRHKLMLGLFLVVGLMALLLGGTLRGLWSYYITTGLIRAKTNELKASDDLKVDIAILVSPPSLAELRAYPNVKDKTSDIHTKLDEYGRQLQVNLGLRSDPGKSIHALGLLEKLTTNLKNFETAVVSEAKDYEQMGPEEQRGRSEKAVVESEMLAQLVAGCTADLAMPVTGRVLKATEYSALCVKPVSAVQREVALLTHAAQELRDYLYEELNNHLNEARGHYQIALWIIVPSSVVGLLLMAGLMFSFYAWIFYPIRDLEAGVKRVANGDFDHRIDVHSGDEMEDLGAAFNDMMKRLHDLYSDLARQVNERSRQLVRSERLASVGFLAAGVAHEINNPLASIAFCSEALEVRLADLLAGTPARSGGRMSDERELFVKYLKMIQEEAFRCKSITERLLAFSRTGEPKREMTDLSQLVQSVLDITQHLQNCRGKQIAFEKPAVREGVPGAGRIEAPVSAEEIKSVVLNLVVNALDSMEEGGKLTIQLLQKEGMAQMRFMDTGCGMTQEVLENIFEPFYTRSRTGKGTGLGLTISHRIISQHGGEIEAASPGQNMGSTFVVRLPLHVEEAPPPATLPMPHAPKGKAA